MITADYPAQPAELQKTARLMQITLAAPTSCNSFRQDKPSEVVEFEPIEPVVNLLYTISSRLRGDAAIDAAMKQLYVILKDDKSSRGHLCDSILSNVDVSKLSLDVALAVATITFSSKNELKGRTNYLNRVYPLMVRELGEKQAAKIRANLS